MEPKKKSITTSKIAYIISPESWGPYYLSKHHYALALCHAGYQVFFINPPKTSYQKNAGPKPNLYIIDYPRLKGLNKLPAFIIEWIEKWIVRKLKAKLDLPPPDLIITFDPYRFINTRLFNPEAKIVYYAADLHKSPFEQTISNFCDLVVGPSHYCIEKISHPNKHFIHHGLASHFMLEEIESMKLPGPPHDKIKIGYVGNLAMRFIDHELLYKAIKNNTNAYFYLVGPSGKSNLAQSEISGKLKMVITKILALPNVIHINQIDNQQLPSFLRAMDGFIMCYDHTKWMKESSNSHKIMEYLSTGKCIISLPIYHYTKSNLLTMIEKEDYVSVINEFIHNHPLFNAEHLIKERKKFAFSHAYQNQLNTILSYLNE
jgi:hypothetical protein